MSNRAAALTIFLAWYVAAFVTTLAVQGKLFDTLLYSGKVLLVALLVMSVMFVVSRVLNRTDVVDAGWPIAFVAMVLYGFMNNPYDVAIGINVQTLASGLVIIWGLRLFYAMVGRLRKNSEDKRYVELRKNWKGNEAVNTYVRVFAIQAFLAWVIAASVNHVNVALPQTVTWVAIGGLVIWLVGFVFEAVGDWQLKRFLANPTNKGKIMARGLWRYTRHPNYFGEVTMWWGIFLVALATPNGWLAIISPVVITYLLLFVSGIPMTEQSFENKPGWSVYKRRVSVFFPLPPKT
ncbi:MAG TPA: DUF1295 domain-containing protein [Candidatus Saccharibacteria bacterium]|nr:DUF1295 domain-containing protein [Candidatus Saccharibacteria bacterium]HRK94305.1 DUF1295 domain-containing protein [Candidatus Saccharibacteria bacterium]